MAGASLLGTLATAKASAGKATQIANFIQDKEFGGSDFSGWETVLGDGIYAAPGEGPLDESDVETIHYGNHSELRANVQPRNIMAHNITYKRIIDENAFEYIYTGGYQFRLPYMPATDNQELNGQTLEGGMFVWDGGDTRLDYGLAFQWMLNPFGDNDFNIGDLRCWTDIDGEKWQTVGHLPPDTNWHTVLMVLDVRRQTTALTIDGDHFPCRFTATPKPATWGTETAPGLQAEIISMYPGEQGFGTLHKAEFRDWFWKWEHYTSCEIYLPAVIS